MAANANVPTRDFILLSPLFLGLMFSSKILPATSALCRNYKCDLAMHQRFDFIRVKIEKSTVPSIQIQRRIIGEGDREILFILHIGEHGLDYGNSSFKKNVLSIGPPLSRPQPDAASLRNRNPIDLDAVRFRRDRLRSEEHT